MNQLEHVDRGRLSRALSTPRPSPNSSVRIDGYEILAELHRGGQGVVYKAVQLGAKRTVALKTLLHGAFATPRQRQRFEREIELVASLHHPHIVPLYDSGVSSDGLLFFAMKLIDGVQLDRHLRLVRDQTRDSRENQSIRKTLRLIQIISSAVNYAHQRGIAHRDLKPGNILIDRSGEPHVLDFGLARVQREFADGQSSVTIAGEFIGTFAYASPEQMSGDPLLVDIRTDVYALGVVLYEMLTGHLPISVEGGIADVVHRITHAEPTPPKTYCRKIDGEVEAIVLKALAKEPERRYQFAGALAEDIRRYLAGEPIEAKQHSTWYVLRKATRRFKVPIAMGAVVVLLVLVFAVAMSIQAGRLAIARDLATGRSARLARQLHLGNIERGRTLGLAGNIPAAERLLWREFLAPPLPERNGQPFEATLDAGSLDADWALWELYSRHPCLNTWTAHETSVQAIGFSPDGSQLASLGTDGSIRLWRSADGEKLGSHEGTAALETLQFSPNGETLVSWGSSEICLWDTKTGIITSHEVGIGERCRVFGFDKQVRPQLMQTSAHSVTIQTVGDHQRQVVYRDEKETIRDAWLSGDGNVLLLLDRSGVLSIRDLPTGHELTNMQLGSDLVSVVFSPDGTMVAVMQYAGPWRLVDLHSGVVLRLDARQMSDSMLSYCFSPNGRSLFMGSRRRQIHRWDVQSGRKLTSLAGHRHGVSALCLSADGGRLASASSNGTIRIWETSPDMAARHLEGHTSTVFSVRFHPNGHVLVSCGLDTNGHAIKTWDVKTGRLIHTFLGHDAHIATIALSPDGSMLASGSYDGVLILWSLEDRRRVATLIGHEDEIHGIHFMPDGGNLVSCADDGTIRTWDVESGRCTKVARAHETRIPSITTSPDGRTLVSCGYGEQHLMVWDLPKFETRKTLGPLPATQRALRFSPDGRWVASGGDDRVVRLWEVTTGECVRSFEGHQAGIYSLAFGADGRRLASGARNGVIRLWETDTGRGLATLAGHDLAVFDVCFSPDGNNLASAGEDRTIGLWDLTYYRRHIAGNLAYQIAALETAGVVIPQQNAMMSWATSLLRRDYPQAPSPIVYPTAQPSEDRKRPWSAEE